MLTVATLVLFLFYTRLLNNNGGPTIGLVCKTVNVVLWPSSLTGTIATECYSLEGQFRHKPVKNDGKYWQSSLNYVTDERENGLSMKKASAHDVVVEDQKGELVRFVSE